VRRISVVDLIQRTFYLLEYWQGHETLSIRQLCTPVSHGSNVQVREEIEIKILYARDWRPLCRWKSTVDGEFRDKQESVQSSDPAPPTHINIMSMVKRDRRLTTPTRRPCMVGVD
jgi:hypothetical protein